MRRAALDNPALDSELARGEYESLLGWLREKIHRQGQRHKPQELVEQATGEPTRGSYHVEYLRKKFVVGE